MELNGERPEAMVGSRPSDYFRVVRERKWITVAVMVVAVGLALAYSILTTPTYQATAQVLRQTAALDQTLFGTSLFGFQDAQRQLLTGANLVKINAVALLVKSDLGSTRSVTELLEMIDVHGVSEADVLRISAQSTRPEEAADVANSFASQFILYRQKANRDIIAAADQKVTTELDQMTAEELASERGITLTQKHEELGILAAMQTGGFELVQQAAVPVSPFAPRPVRNVLFALIGGIILGLIIAFLVDYLDRRMKDEETLEREYALPVLASVPRMGRRWIPRESARSRSLIGFSGAQSPFLEAFRTLRSNLRFYQLDKKNQTLVITSGLPQEGKTVTTVNLGLSLALSGARVILLEADLRRPMLHKYLRLDTRVGVSSVLAGTASFSDALQLVQVSDFVPDIGLSGGPVNDSTLQKNLLCMTSGPLPPNPAELLASTRMQELIKMASAYAEFVLIDTPPLLLVSDALNFAGSADGILIATRVKSATSDEAHDVRTMIERSGSRALGLVANGVGRKRRGYYRGRYKGYYAPTEEM